MDYVVIDLETTGLDCRWDRIIEVGAVKISQEVICGEYSTLINPCREIPPEITELTGITPDMVVDRPTWEETAPALEGFSGNSCIFVAHNAVFDRSFLPSRFAEANWLDTLELSKILLPGAPGYSLTNLCRNLEIEENRSHRALDDARATARLFLLLREKLRQVKLPVLEVLYTLCREHQDALAGLISEELTDRVHKFSHEKISSRVLISADPDQSKGMFDSTTVSKNLQYRIAPEEISSFFQPDGPCGKTFTTYEYRNQQVEMAQAVAGSFNLGHHLIVEAGTGTGKSMAYLFPSVLWSVRSGQKVVVSTHTINLQEQLLNKDLPLVQKITGWKFSACVVKGRSHFICLRKWEALLEGKIPGLDRFMMKLVLWLSRTTTGDINELTVSRKELVDWHHFAAHGETCLNTKCRFFRNLCFVSRVRKRAESARILIVNHSLLLSNATLDENILPEFRYLVIDEAHHLETVAEDQFGAQFSYPSLAFLLNRIKRKERGGLAGVLDSFSGRLAGLTITDDAVVSKMKENLEQTVLKVGECREALREFFTLAGEVFSKEPAVGGSGYQTIRILSPFRDTPGWQGLAVTGENLLYLLKELTEGLLNLCRDADYLENVHGLEFSGTGEISFLMSTLKEKIHFVETFFSTDGNTDNTTVRWVEFSRGDLHPVLRTAPVEVRELLAEYLFKQKDAVVLTSATLSVNNKFDFFCHSTGIDILEHPVTTMQLASPFNYQENVLLGIVSDLPDPSHASEMVFIEEVSKSLVELIKAAGGRTLVLFTSHYQLRAVYEKIKAPLGQEGIIVLAHGLNGNRARLLEEFREGNAGVILGANSFWEGIDVAGDALSCVVIVKLPFWPPTLPTVAARLDRYRELKMDGFHKYSLPQAIIRFKQGFGRLIRSHSDHGVICILDRRIWEKRYGRVFLKSLPPVKAQFLRTGELAVAVEKWLGKQNGT